jgi:hypothetical protein
MASNILREHDPKKDNISWSSKYIIYFNGNTFVERDIYYGDIHITS